MQKTTPSLATRASFIHPVFQPPGTQVPSNVFSNGLNAFRRNYLYKNLRERRVTRIFHFNFRVGGKFYSVKL